MSESTEKRDQTGPLSQTEFDLGQIGGKKLKLAMDEPEVTTDGGLPAVASFAKWKDFFAPFRGVIQDLRKRARHGIDQLIQQRVFQIISGNPDANDCDALRRDPALQASLGAEAALASQPTMSRLENSVSRKDLLLMARALVQSFLDSYKEPPEMIVLDMDPTDHLVYGQQELGLFNTHVGDTCLMPFHLYEGLTGRIITTAMRAGKTPVAREILAILKRVVPAIRKRFPKTILIFRADSHHTKPEVMTWMERNDVHYVTGLSQNSRLNAMSEALLEEARARYKLNCADGLPGREVRMFCHFEYAANSWERPRRVVCRVLAGPHGEDRRYIVASFADTGAKYLYETVYCGRGRAELFIKDHKLGLHSDRSPCRSAKANQFRLLVASMCYALMHSFREEVLEGTVLAKATFCQIRVKLLKIGARVERLKTMVRFHLPIKCPFGDVFAKLARMVGGASGAAPAAGFT